MCMCCLCIFQLQVILKALEDANIDLTEVEEVEHEERPGIDYDNLSRYNPKRKWTDDIQPL